MHMNKLKIALVAVVAGIASAIIIPFSQSQNEVEHNSDPVVVEHVFTTTPTNSVPS